MKCSWATQGEVVDIYESFIVIKDDYEDTVKIEVLKDDDEDKNHHVIFDYLLVMEVLQRIQKCSSSKSESI